MASFFREMGVAWLREILQVPRVLGIYMICEFELLNEEDDSEVDGDEKLGRGWSSYY